MALGVSGTATPLRDNRRSEASRRKSPNSYKCRSLFDIRSTREFYETSATDRREKHDVQQRTSGAALGHSSGGGDDETTFARVDPVRGPYVRLAGIWCFRCVARGPADAQALPAVNDRDYWRPIERPALDGRQRQVSDDARHDIPGVRSGDEEDRHRPSPNRCHRRTQL